MKLLGIDDAGRGPVIGPMILSGVLCEDIQQQEIKAWGAKDSKLLTPKRRAEIKEKINAELKSKVLISTPKEIDDHPNLNTLEAEKTAQLINHFSNETKEPLQVIVDCPSTNIEAWTKTVQDLLKNPNQISLSCEHKADFNHPVVAAASILAKEQREDELYKLKLELKIDFGSGYPADPKTKDFLIKNHTNPKFKEIIRFSWNTVKKLQKSSNQKKLF